MKTVCVIGTPIKHSRSPLIHNYWIKALNIEGIYTSREVAEAELADFLRHLSPNGYSGCNVTLPHKERVAALITNQDEKVRRSGSGNTIYIRHAELHLTTTDGEGFINNLKWHIPGLDLTDRRVLILGAGGSARALVDALLREHVGHISIANRTLSRATALADHFPGQVTTVDLLNLKQTLTTVDLLINTTSAGIANHEDLVVPFHNMPKTALVTDINYVPVMTPFLQSAKTAGLNFVPGLGMLLHQAVRGFELWFDLRPEVTQELYDLVARDIESGITG